MPVLQATGIQDLIYTGLRELGELKFTDISAPLQKYYVMRRLLKKSKIDFYSAGYGIQWDIMVDDNGSAQFVGLYATDNVNVPNVMQQGTADWRHITWNWAMDRREITMNGAARRIVDLMQTRRIASFVSAIKKFETAFWRVPASTNTTDPYGAPYWVPKSATANTTNNGFNGLAPSGYTSVGGLSATTYPAWAAYAGPYTAVSVDDLIPKWEHMADHIAFEPPVENEPTFNTGDDYGWFTTYTVYQGIKQILKGQNEDLGMDLDPMDGKPVFRRGKVNWVPQLDADVDNPIYGLNFGEFKTAGLRGEWLKETIIPVRSDQHTVSTQHVDCSLQWVVRDRRRNGVLSTGTSGSV